MLAASQLSTHPCASSASSMQHKCTRAAGAFALMVAAPVLGQSRKPASSHLARFFLGVVAPGALLGHLGDLPFHANSRWIAFFAGLLSSTAPQMQSCVKEHPLLGACRKRIMRIVRCHRARQVLMASSSLAC